MRTHLLPALLATLVFTSSCNQETPTSPRDRMDSASLSSVQRGSASAQEAQTRTVLVKIMPQASLLEDGNAVRVTTKIGCDPEAGEVLEAFVYVTQAGNESQFAGIPLRCTTQQDKYQVRVAAYPDAPFTPGRARVSAFVLLYDPTTEETVSGGDTREVKIR